MALARSNPDNVEAFLRERVRTPARYSVLRLLGSERRAWHFDAIAERTALPRSEINEALGSLEIDGLVQECCVSNRWMYEQQDEADSAALSRLFEAHRDGRIDPLALLNQAALARIRQSARLLIRNGLHYQEDTARLATPRLESGEHVILRVENDATAPDGEAQGRAPRE